MAGNTRIGRVGVAPMSGEKYTWHTFDAVVLNELFSRAT